MSEQPIGRKYDGGKIRPDLIPAIAIRQMGALLGYGAEKYDEDNWKRHEYRLGQRRHTAAMIRHLTAWQDGEALDPESGLHHLSAVLTNAVFILWAENQIMVERGEDPMPETWRTPPPSPSVEKIRAGLAGAVTGRFDATQPSKMMIEAPADDPATDAPIVGEPVGAAPPRDLGKWADCRHPVWVYDDPVQPERRACATCGHKQAWVSDDAPREWRREKFKVSVDQLAVDYGPDVTLAPIKCEHEWRTTTLVRKPGSSNAWHAQCVKCPATTERIIPPSQLPPWSGPEDKIAWDYADQHGLLPEAPEDEKPCRHRWVAPPSPYNGAIGGGLTRAGVLFVCADCGVER